MRGQTLAVGIVLTLFGTGTRAVQTKVDLMAIDEALRFTRSGTPTEWTQFNRQYRVTVGKAPVDYLEVITPYRRVVLEGSAGRSLGDRSFGQRQALELLKTSGDTLDVSVEVTFSPLNTYIGVPDCRVELVGFDGRRIAPLETFRSARWTPRVEGPPSATPRATAQRPSGATMLGATVVGRFGLAALKGDGVYDADIDVAGESKVRVTITLGGMR